MVTEEEQLMKKKSAVMCCDKEEPERMGEVWEMICNKQCTAREGTGRIEMKQGVQRGRKGRVVMSTCLCHNNV